MIRLAFRIVVLSSLLNNEELYQRILALFSPLGKLYDFRNNPYSKIAGSHTWLIEFDIPGGPDGEIDRLLELVGGTGWLRSEDDGVQVAIWAAESGDTRPLSEHIYWAEIQMIPHAQLAASRKTPISRA